MDIVFEVEYPKRFVKKLARFAVGCIILYRRKYPAGEKVGKVKNYFLKILFYVLAWICSLTWLTLDRLERKFKRKSA